MIIFIKSIFMLVPFKLFPKPTRIFLHFAFLNLYFVNKTQTKT